MHNIDYIHRDLKPDNIMIGLGEDSVNVIFVDFGLSKSVIDSRTGKHIPLVTGKKLVGTCRYASLNSHRGFELSKRDDLISVGYCMINLLTGSLPWQGKHSSNASTRYKIVGKMKERCTNKVLCEDLPPQFFEYMTYVTRLEFEQAADFDYLKQLVLSAA